MRDARSPFAAPGDGAILAIYAGSGRYCHQCGSLRNPEDFSRVTRPGDVTLAPNGVALVACDYCHEADAGRWGASA